MKQRTSTHRGKGGYARHNEHRFYSKESRDTTLHSFKGVHQPDNTKWDLMVDEMKFYERYSNQLEEQNEKHRSRRQYKRVKTLKEFYETKRYKPSETIYQYGHQNGYVVPTKEDYEEITKEFVKRLRDWSKDHGNHLVILNYANHYDETTPHTHLREVWEYKDENGVLKVGQEKAMELAGIELPDPSKKEGRYNNRVMTYTKMVREMWQDVCEEYGYEVERVPLQNGRNKHETVPQFHARKTRELELWSKSIKRKEQYERKILSRKRDALEEKEKNVNDAIEYVYGMVSDITGHIYNPQIHSLDELHKGIEEYVDGIAKRNERSKDYLEQAKECYDSAWNYQYDVSNLAVKYCDDIKLRETHKEMKETQIHIDELETIQNEMNEDEDSFNF